MMLELERLRLFGSRNPIELDSIHEELKYLVNCLENPSSDGSVDKSTEKIADKLMILCPKLLSRAEPPNKTILLTHGLNIDEVFSRMDQVESGEKVIIGIDTSLDNEILLEIEKALLFHMSSVIRQTYQRACLTKVLAIMTERDINMVEKRKRAREVWEEAKNWFSSFDDKEAIQFIEEQLDNLGMRIGGNEVVDVSRSGEGTLRVLCPCCKEIRPCTPFENVAQLAMSSVPGRVPYLGILFCPKCLYIGCGEKVPWRELKEKRAELIALKQKGFHIPDDAGIYSAICPQCNDDSVFLYTLNAATLEELARKTRL